MFHNLMNQPLATSPRFSIYRNDVFLQWPGSCDFKTPSRTTEPGINCMMAGNPKSRIDQTKVIYHPVGQLGFYFSTVLGVAVNLCFATSGYQFPYMHVVAPKKMLKQHLVGRH